MIDAILYVPAFDQLVGHLDANHPEMLERDEEGELVTPPVVTGFGRTPACIKGNSLQVYARLTDEKAQQWRDIPYVEILSESEYIGKETSEIVYEQLFNNPEALAKYDSVYDRSPREVDDGEGGTMTITPPAKFGVMA